ncbi:MULTISPECIES: hypothetical protein [Pseudoalteromonas]|uniref:hypothetical protein n=1 Tax=Pseudoalteromonas TaxID=53246 RepID=UPI001EF4BECD|nr:MULTISPECIES: hypothetical protein [Pseudoalteromonas]MCG7563070.1 hypothetical protein [Pseudoalteromonas sp. McH1-42]MEC4091679.1 hypothetical protein [Pseudoalteromonas rubra]
MHTYFESHFDTSADVFVWLFPYIFVLVLLYKVPFFLNIFSELLRISNRRLLGSCSLFGLLLFWVQLTAYREVAGYRDLVEDGSFTVLEGCIENLRVIDAKSRGESFTLKNVTFSYSDAATSPLFFANRQFEDGVVREGRCVKVFYIGEGRNNKIFKIQLLD